MSRNELDHSWEALLQPGRSVSFFSTERRPALEAPSRHFSPATAWWLAELSRLIYVQHAEETGTPSEVPARATHLAPVGGEELTFFSQGGTQAALVRFERTDAAPIHVLVFRGTHDLRDWLSNINVRPANWPGGGAVHRGFVEALDRIWDEIETALSDHAVDADSLFLAGHSLGGALATLAAARRPPGGVYTFGAPRVGDEAFNRCLAGVPIHRIVNDRDIVPKVPTPGPLLRFRHAGVRHRLMPDGGIHSGSDREDLGRRLQGALSRTLEGLVRRSVLLPPRRLSDHAPINYCARLDRLRP